MTVDMVALQFKIERRIMKLAIVGALVALSTLAAGGTANAQSYAADTIVIDSGTGFTVNFAQATKMFAGFAAEVREAGGCRAYVLGRYNTRADGTAGDKNVLPLGVDPLVAACEAGIASR